MFFYHKLLLIFNKEANIHFSNDKPLRLAAEHRHKNVIELLLKAGANVHVYNDYALRWASRNGHKDVVELLKKYMNEK